MSHGPAPGTQDADVRRCASCGAWTMASRPHCPKCRHQRLTDARTAEMAAAAHRGALQAGTAPHRPTPSPTPA